MKVFLVVTGLLIVAICWLIDSNTFRGGEIHWGYFLVSFGCIVSAALWRVAPKDMDCHRQAFDIYNFLSQDPLSPEELLNKLTQGHPDWEIADAYKSVIGQLTSQGKLIVRDGQLVIAPHPDAGGGGIGT